MKHFHIFSALVLSTLLSACSTVEMNTQSTSVSYTNHISVKPILEIGKRINGVCNTTTIVGLVTLGDGDNQAVGVTFNAESQTSEAGLSPFSSISLLLSKPDGGPCTRAASYDAVTKNNADVILAPRYIIEKSGIPYIWENTRVQVSGYKGTINGFKVSD